MTDFGQFEWSFLISMEVYNIIFLWRLCPRFTFLWWCCGEKGYHGIQRWHEHEPLGSTYSKIKALANINPKEVGKPEAECFKHERYCDFLCIIKIFPFIYSPLCMYVEYSPTSMWYWHFISSRDLTQKEQLWPSTTLLIRVGAPHFSMMPPIKPHHTAIWRN